MKNIFSWITESNRWKHLVGGIIIGIGANDVYCAAYAGIGIASALELKDKTTGSYEKGTGLTNPFDSVNEINLKYAYADDGDHYSPSPYYSNGTLNSNYIATKNSNGDSITNALSDIDGYANTQILIEDADVVAAKRCGVFAPNNYGQGKWYLPAIGELAFIMPRWNEIQAALGSVDGGVQLASDGYYWSSTEYDSDSAWSLTTYRGSVLNRSKDNRHYVRAFLAL